MAPREAGPSVCPVRKSHSLIQDEVDVRGGLAWFLLRTPSVPYMPWVLGFMVVEISGGQGQARVAFPLRVLGQEVPCAEQ